MKKKIVRCEGGLVCPPYPVYENDDEFESLLRVARAAKTWSNSLEWTGDSATGWYNNKLDFDSLLEAIKEVEHLL